jgi:RiboL-PSP-HEPN
VLFEIEQRFKSLEDLIVAAADKNQDERTASYFCRLGCVQICGNLERCVALVLIARLGDRSPTQFGNFLRRYFDRGTNYDCDRICQLLYRFDADWGRAFEDFVKANDHLKESVSSCYAIRNSVAHGGSPSLGPKILRQYYEASLSIVCELEGLVR